MHRKKKNIDDIIIDFQMTGPCEISIEKTVEIWDKDWSISQWEEEYTLCHHNPKSDNFTMTDLKIRISKKQTHQLIGELDLINERSPVFRSGSTWRRKEKETLKKNDRLSTH